MKVIKEADALMTVTGEKKLYGLQNSNVVVISELPVKSAKVSFYTEEEWAKIQKQLKKVDAYIAKQQSLDNKVTEAKP